MTFIDALDSQSPQLIAVLGAAVLLALWAIRPRLSGKRPASRRRWQNRTSQWNGGKSPRSASARVPVIDAGEQLRTVLAAQFTKQQVLSASEARVMIEAERAIAELAMPWRVMAQVSLGEILRSEDAAAFSAVNSKRVDLLIVDERHQPIAAVEYQGTGHWQGNAAARDAVKKEALRKAGVAYIEVIAGSHLPADLHREIARLARLSSKVLA